jgi:hypothetical protein
MKDHSFSVQKWYFTNFVIPYVFDTTVSKTSVLVTGHVVPQ